MKKFLVPLFLLLLLSCSNDGFESKYAAPAQKDLILCLIKVEGQNKCVQISESICTEMGGTKEKCNLEGDVSSSSDDVSSSSDVAGVSSSTDIDVGGGSSSSAGVVDGSSSSAGVVDGSSSSTGVVGGSSSSAGVSDDSSSSGGVVGGSSSSTGVVGGSSSSAGVSDDSSSSGGVVGGSSSSAGVGGGSSSSVSAVSSSSSVGVSSSSLAPPSLGECTPLQFPDYVAKTQKESLKKLITSIGNANGCTVSYTPSSASGFSISGDEIDFSKYSSSSRTLSLNITARITCSGSQPQQKNCTKEVYVADDYKAARCNHSFPANLNITKSTTVIDYACCEPKGDFGNNDETYYITCSTPNFTLKIDDATPITKIDSHANLPALPLKEETPYPDCQEYGKSPGNVLYHYSKRILMTATNVPTGGFSCDSW